MPALSGQGALFEGGIHWISFLANLGPDARADPGRARRRRERDSIAASLVTIEYAEGPVATLAYSWEIRGLAERRPLVALLWHRRHAAVRDQWPAWRGRPAGASASSLPGVGDLVGYRAMLADFFEAIRHNRAAGLHAGARRTRPAPRRTGVRVARSRDSRIMTATALLTAAGIGMLAGLHTATWGMYKDSIHEGFFWPRYFRSPIVGIVMGVIAYVIARPALDSAASIVSVLRRRSTCSSAAPIELWKTFLRNEDQSKYFIPMQFAVFGNVVQSQSRRLHHRRDHHGGGLRDVSARALRRAAPDPAGPRAGRCLRLRPSAAGFPRFSAPGKTRRVEGFQPLKFVRSPLWSGFWGLLLAHFNISILVVMMAGLGFTIFTLETYKTFFFPSKPRGKFAGKPILFPEMLRRRQPFIAALCGDLAVRAGWLLAGAHRAARRARVDPLSRERNPFRAGPAAESALSHARDRRRCHCTRRRGRSMGRVAGSTAAGWRISCMPFRRTC